MVYVWLCFDLGIFYHRYNSPFFYLLIDNNLIYGHYNKVSCSFPIQLYHRLEKVVGAKSLRFDAVISAYISIIRKLDSSHAK